MATPQSLGSEFRLGECTIEAQAHRMKRGGRTHHLEPKVMATLVYLAERAGEVVEKEEILSRVWPDTVVSEVSLPRTVSELRRALDDDAREPRYIETIPKRGYRLIAEVAPLTATAGAADRPRPRRRWLAAAALLAVTLGAWGISQWTIPSARSGIESLAVLPLRNLSDHAGEEYFADAMTDLLITDLANLGGVRVISSTSVMRYKEHRLALPEIARELGVDAIVEGTILRANNRVRITVQLIDGTSDDHLWAESYERRFGDILKLQGEVATAIARSINLSLQPERLARLDRRPQVATEAYDLYLKGHERLQNRWQRKSGENLLEAIDYYQQSLAIDSSNAPAYAGLSDAYMLLADSNIRPHQEMVPKARRAALKALRLDPDLAQAHVALAMIRYLFELDWYSADLHFRRGLELDPSYATGRQWYAMYLASVGRDEEAVAEAEAATSLDPFSKVIRMSAAGTYYLTRHYDRAAREFEEVGRIHPSTGEPTAKTLSWLRVARDRTAPAVADFREQHGGSCEESKSEDPRDEVAKPDGSGSCGECAYAAALLHAVSGEIDPAFRCLDQVFEDRTTRIVDVRAEPMFDSLRDDPRFEQLLAELDF